MVKNLFYIFLFLSGISFYQSKGFTGEIANIYTVPTNVAASNITFTSANITWDPIPSNQYILEFRPVGASTWINMYVGSITAFNLVTLQPCTAYELRIRDAVNTNDVSESIFFVTSLDYCASSSLNSGTYISNVKVTPSGGTQINNNSAASGYSNFYNNLGLQMQFILGSTNNVLSVTKAWSGVQSAAAVSAWIDFNGNGIFESAERIMDSTVSLTSPVTANFTVPSGSMSGGNCGVTMRVIVSSGTIASACGTFPVGEVEDYKVTFVNGNLSAAEAQKKQELTVYPNPVSEILYISGISSATDFEIYNAVGQKVDEGKTSEQVNVYHLIKGTYFIQIKDKKMKFIKR
ncbi:GEVED domain-containing protein [Chryseobacterium daecheongense]|uniref:GEVED domain-containing protein n=1 Tax=Chryseobacterium daecheongense TaxID=192389 RepID=UPI001FD6E4A6|nr:GEVED domain-containing protein [Chryseobacterium daecheongense]UOU96919.1 GEVED domain-containing protein [Chryseobacterium daecheongense]